MSGGGSHRKLHRYLDEKGGEKACHYCDIPLVCWCDELVPCGDAHTSPPGAKFFQMDHVVPKARGGSNRLSNLVPCCGPCNVRKGAS